MKKRLAVAFLAAATFSATFIGTPGAQNADAKSPWTTKTFRTATGLQATSVSDGTTTVTTYGNTKVNTIETGANGSSVTVTPAPRSQDAQRSGSIPPTIYEMTLASGMSPEDACEFAQDMDGYGCRTSAEVTAQRKASGPSPSAVETGQVYDSDCFDHVTTEGDGSKHAHACVVRRWDFSNASTWWMSNHMKTTGWVEDPGTMYDRLTGVGIQAKYKAADSTAIDWAPYTTETVGSCRQQTTTVSGRSGTSFSTTNTICPDTLSPWHSPEFQYFGAKWSGGPVGEGHSRGAVATSIQRIPKPQGVAYTIGSHLAWN